MTSRSVEFAVPAPLPAPRVPIVIRPAVLSDVPFMDSLQKMHTKMVGFMPTAQFEGNIRAGRVLIAEESAECSVLGAELGNSQSSALSPQHSIPIGYCLGSDRYFKHDDVGIIYQMNVMPGRQRSLVGAMLLKAQFERSAYGCKLYCCWCAQDIAANRFWEAMGFVPLAFRTGGTGSGKKAARIHIFWQKRIRSGDTTTPWWFPSETSGGAVRSNRIVLPIPPGTHWSDAKPVVLPGMPSESAELKVLSAERRKRKPRMSAAQSSAPSTQHSVAAGGLRFAVVGASSETGAKAKAKREPKPKVKNDPQLVAAARELKDRWLEQVNSGEDQPKAIGKYDVCREIDDAGATEITETELLTVGPAKLLAA